MSCFNAYFSRCGGSPLHAISLLLTGLAIGWIFHGFSRGPAKPTREEQNNDIAKSPNLKYLRSHSWRNDRGVEITTSDYGSSNVDLSESNVTALLKAISLEEMARMGQLKLEGEFILELETMFDREGYKRLWSEEAGRIAERRNESGHSNLLSSFGVPVEDIGRLERHLDKITLAAAEVETARLQHLSAQFEFQKKLELMLSNPQQEQYRTYHETLRGFSDLKNISAYADSQGIQISHDSLNEISHMIRDNQGWTFESWSGPFDEPSTPGITLQQAIDIRQARLSSMEQARDRMANAVHTEMADPLIGQIIIQYYEKRIFDESQIVDAIRKQLP